MNFSKKIISPLGELYIVASETALIALDNNPSELFQKADQVSTHPILDLTEVQLAEYFNGNRIKFEIPLDPKGTPFQQKVWGALLKIPFGKVWSYGEQAQFLKSPKASRAVGGANGKNPIAIIIPCHRVIGSTGKLTGYSGGMDLKIGLLQHEGHQIDGLQLLK